MRTNVCRILSLSLSLSFSQCFARYLHESAAHVRLTFSRGGTDDERSRFHAPRNNAHGIVHRREFSAPNGITNAAIFRWPSAVTYAVTAADRRGNGRTSRCMKDGRPVNCDRIIGRGRKVYCDGSIGGCLG